MFSYVLCNTKYCLVINNADNQYNYFIHKLLITVISIHFCNMYWKILYKLINENKWFYTSYAVLVLIAGFLQISTAQFSVSIAINKLNTPWLDVAFTYLTHIGDGFFAVGVVVIVLVFKRKNIWDAIACLAIPGLLTQFLKRMVFTGHFRPSFKMKHIPNLHYINGVDMHELYSFPSGHSTSAFALFLLLSFYIKNKTVGAALCFAAALVAITRIYLLQHFLEDVLLGSIIGVVCCTLIYAIFETKRAKN